MRKARPRPDRATRSRAAVGQLDDGTVYVAPLGELPYDAHEDRIQCHLCGEWFRSIGSRHLMAKSERYRI